VDLVDDSVITYAHPIAVSTDEGARRGRTRVPGEELDRSLNAGLH
jgi:hypothetical protein